MDIFDPDMYFFQYMNTTFFIYKPSEAQNLAYDRMTPLSLALCMPEIEKRLKRRFRYNETPREGVIYGL